MNKNILIVIGGAVLVAVLMAVLVQLLLGGNNQQPQQVVVKKEPMVNILTAKNDLKVGAKPQAADVEWKAWPEKSLIPDMIVQADDQKAAEAVKSRLRAPVEAGKPILNSYLMDGMVNIVAASLEPGMRAVSIQVSAETMVAGFISPGDYVDVMLTYRKEIKADPQDDPRVLEMIELSLDSMAVETILENVRVMAVDQKAEPDNENIKVGRTVTLALNVEDAEKVILARQIGSLTLVLRNPEDKLAVNKDRPITSDARLIAIDNEINNNYKKIKDQTGIQTKNVRLYKGSQIDVISTR